MRTQLVNPEFPDFYWSGRHALSVAQAAAGHHCNLYTRNVVVPDLVEKASAQV